MLKKTIKLFVGLVVTLFMIGLLGIALPRLITGLYSSGRISSPAESDSRPVAIVFGAGLQRDGEPTAVLQDRVRTAADLYFAGKAEKLLMSGDNRFVDYNEPAAMQSYALDLGVPPEAIVLDFAGRRTYDTCYRAKAIFGVQQAILVTQRFHLPRALYTCNLLGVDSSGVAAEGHYYLKRSRLYWTLRELLATPVALWQVHVSKPLPVLGAPEPIFATHPSTSPNGVDQ